MQVRTYCDLRKENGTRFYFRREALQGHADFLEEFLKSEPQLHTEVFAKKMMFSHEIKANNLVEGYGDGIEEISRAIENAESIKDKGKRVRILNLYHAYNYILQRGTIDRESLRTLYGITSKDALEKYDVENMGEYYRNKPVYILKNGRLDMELNQGVESSRIEEFMEAYFNFLNTMSPKDETDEYIKSQILHFYFVYIHPYFDVNGRTSRTLAMWYLLNKNIYPYIIFNRGIAFKGSQYDRIIDEGIKSNDMTHFLKMMLETVRLELEKEYVMQTVASQATAKLTATDFQTLLYFLSMKGLKTSLDFALTYNRLTNLDTKRAKDIYEEMIVPLLDKGVLDIKGETKKEVQGMKNKILVLRPVELDPKKVVDLHI